MGWLVVGGIAAAMAGSAYAAPRKEAVPTSVPAAQSYCPDANTLVRISGAPEDVVGQILRTCPSNARLMLPMGNNYVIMHVCDVPKGLQPIGNEVMCSMIAAPPVSACAASFRAAFPEYKGKFIAACEGDNARRGQR